MEPKHGADYSCNPRRPYDVAGTREDKGPDNHYACCVNFSHSWKGKPTVNLLLSVLFNPSPFFFFKLMFISFIHSLSIQTCTHALAHAYIRSHFHTFMHARVSMHSRSDSHMHARPHACTHIHAYAHSHECTHSHKHACTH